MAAPPNRRAPGLLLAWLVIDASIAVYLWLDGPSTPSRIMLAGGIALLLYVLLRRLRRGEQPGLANVELGIGLLVVLALAARIAIPFRPELPAPTIPIPALAAVALAALGAWFAVRIGERRQAGPASSGTHSRATVLGAGALVVVVAAGLLARFTIVAWDIQPTFDVHLIQEAAGRAILSGENPYLTRVYAPGYPYWPGSALLAAAGLLVGDARWGLLACDALIVMAFTVIARNVGAPARIGALAGALLLWNSSGLYMTWQSLPEAAVIASAAVGIAGLTAPRSRGRVAGIALGLAVAIKQLGLGLLPFLVLSRHGRQRTAFVIASIVAGLLVGAFLVLDPTAFIGGSVASHLVEPSRNYAINLLDPLPGIVPRLHVPFAFTAVISLGIALAVRMRWPDAIDGWLAATVALLMVAFALIGISFLNYYQIPLALILLLVMIPDGWTSRATDA